MKNGKQMETTEIKFVRNVTGYRGIKWIRNITIKVWLGIFNLGDQKSEVYQSNGKLMFYKWKVDVALRQILTYWPTGRVLHPILKWQNKYALQGDRTGYVHA
jgi:hypothetical protein